MLRWLHCCGASIIIVAWVNENTQVPLQYVRDNEIVLNIGATAAHNLTIDDKWVHFAARFNGISHDIWIPVGHVSSIFARETGEGMGFDVEPLIEDDGANQSNTTTQHDIADAKPSISEDKTDGGKKGLKIVK